MFGDTVAVVAKGWARMRRVRSMAKAPPRTAVACMELTTMGSSIDC